jgi:RNA polymerase sigma factor (sigma-70 family)
MELGLSRDDREASDMIEWEQALPELRAKLLRRARGLGMDPATAEDLVQDALSEAWRLRDRLYDPTGVDRWLSAILTNIHLRWLRQRARDAAYHAGQLAGDEPADRSADWSAGSFDVEAELERHELAELLDRAMGQLPEETRHVLVQRFVDEMPISELAARLDVSPGAVRMRLQRGKLALREVLTTTCRDDALAYGLIREAEAGGWKATSIWCPLCGAVRLRGRFCEPGHRLEMTCPLNCEMAISCDSVIYGGVAGFRPAIKRVMAYAHDFFRDGIRDADGRPYLGTVHTGLTPGGLHEVWIDDLPPWPRTATTLTGQALSSPEGRRFWQEHPRIRMTSYHELEAEGEPAVLSSFTSVTSAAQLDVVLSRKSLWVIRAHRR